MNESASGIGLGSVIAAIVSYAHNGSVLWALFHAVLGWFYIIYAVMAY